MAFDEFDAGAGYGFGLKIDGVEVPRLMEVSGLKMSVAAIELKQNTADGKYKITKVMGRQEAREVTITRGLTQDKVVNDWLKTVMQGDIKGARKNANVKITDYKGEPVKEFTLTNVWVKSVEMGTLKAGSTDVLTEKFVLVYEEMSVA